MKIYLLEKAKLFNAQYHIRELEVEKITNARIYIKNPLEQKVFRQDDRRLYTSKRQAQLAYVCKMEEKIIELEMLVSKLKNELNIVKDQLNKQ